jgi:hypothetical protein
MIPSTPARFSVPQHGLSYPTVILSRGLDLIERGVWAGMKAVRLRRWMKNFVTDEDRYFAACVLDGLIYRSDEQTTALVRHLFERSLSDLVRASSCPLGRLDDWLERLRSDVDPKIRLVPAVKRADATHKSAHLVSRLMKRQLSVRPNWVAKPWEIAAHITRGAQVLVFIDDFLGTGKQFEELIVSENLGWIFGSAYVIYAPFAAHRAGIEYLNSPSRYPALKIVAAEVLDKRHQLFESDGCVFDDGINTPELAQMHYFDMLGRVGISLTGDDRLGFGGLGLSYCFEHAVPDNNLPLLWHPGRSDWVPLFDR